MQVLIIDKAAELDDADLWTLHLRGYDLTRAASLEDGVRYARHMPHDCSLVGVPDSDDPAAGEERDDRLEICALAGASVLGVVTSETAAVGLANDVRNRAVYVGPPSDFVHVLDRIERPALAVASRFDPGLGARIRETGRTVSMATTLQFAMTLLTGGWCQTVLLEADVPGLTDDGNVTVFERFNARHLAVLAPTAGGIGIVRRARPRTIDGWMALIESVAECRGTHCGRAEPIADRIV